MKKSKTFVSLVLVIACMVSTIQSLVISVHSDNDKAKNKVHLLFDEEDILNLPKTAESYDISVFVELAYSEQDYLDLSDSAKEQNKNKIKNQHKKINKKIAQITGLEEDYFSEYAPFAEIVFDSWEEYLANEKDLYKLAKKKEIADIDVSIAYSPSFYPKSSSIAPEGVPPEYSFSQAKEDIGIMDNEETGNGIRVGVIEQGLPIGHANIPENTDEKTYYELVDGLDEYGAFYDTHAVLLCSILGGTTGIARDATFVFAAQSAEPRITVCIEKLMDKDVDIINLSIGPRTKSGNYYNFCEYIDYVINHYHVLMVIAAGNYEIVESPATASNALTVGSITVDKEVANGSAYVSNNPGINKPDLVAPGDNIVGIANIDFTNSNYAYDNNSGTSFAAPMVTGIAARLMERYPELIGKPHLLKALLCASCELLPTQDLFDDEHCGAGLINYQKALEMMEDGGRFTIAKPSLGNVNSQNCVIIPPNTYARIVYSVIIPGKSNTFIDDGIKEDADGDQIDDDLIEVVTPVPITTYKVSMTNLTGNFTHRTSYLSDTTGVFGCRNDTESAIIVVLNIEVEEDDYFPRSERIAFISSVPVHKHSFSQGTHAISMTQHVVYCDCGLYQISPHFYDSTVSSYICADCGYDDSTCMYDDHIHTFDTYESFSREKHKNSCSCGEYIVGNHAGDEVWYCYLCSEDYFSQN